MNKSLVIIIGGDNIKRVWRYVALSIGSSSLGQEKLNFYILASGIGKKNLGAHAELMRNGFWAKLLGRECCEFGTETYGNMEYFKLDSTSGWGWWLRSCWSLAVLLVCGLDLLVRELVYLNWWHSLFGWSLDGICRRVNAGRHIWHVHCQGQGQVESLDSNVGRLTSTKLEF